MEPRFVEWREKLVVGLGARFISILSEEKNNAEVIPRLWEELFKQIGGIKNKVGNDSFGVVEMVPPGEGKEHKEELFYIAGVEVADLGGVPVGMIERVIPAGRYALFTHRGKLDGLERTMRYIYREWLPKAGVALREAPHLELYDRRFNPMSEESELDILLPVE